MFEDGRASCGAEGLAEGPFVGGVGRVFVPEGGVQGFFLYEPAAEVYAGGFGGTPVEGGGEAEGVGCEGEEGYLEVHFLFESAGRDLAIGFSMDRHQQTT